jgi:hypothetical protein
LAGCGWKRAFDDPIPLPDGRELVTLQDAGHYITKLPKAEHDAPEWQAAMQALILVAAKGGATMLARIGMMQISFEFVRNQLAHDQPRPHAEIKAVLTRILSVDPPKQLLLLLGRERSWAPRSSSRNQRAQAAPFPSRLSQNPIFVLAPCARPIATPRCAAFRRIGDLNSEPFIECRLLRDGLQFCQRSLGFAHDCTSAHRENKPNERFVGATLSCLVMHIDA